MIFNTISFGSKFVDYESQKKFLIKNCSVVKYIRGQTILTEGGKADRIMVIKNGTCVLSKLVNFPNKHYRSQSQRRDRINQKGSFDPKQYYNAKDIPLIFLNRGSVFGEESFLHLPNSYSVKVDSCELEVYSIKTSLFRGRFTKVKNDILKFIQERKLLISHSISLITKQVKRQVNSEVDPKVKTQMD